MDGVTVENVSLTLRRATILNDVSAQFPQGTITGIVGNNGSGKSMLLKCVCGFIRPDRGKITVFGKDYLALKQFPQSMGFIIEAPGFLPELSGIDNLMMLSRIRNRIGSAEMRAAMEQVGLNPAEKKSVKKYSMGMKQRLGIAQAIMENPILLLLDEPMNGLDSGGVHEMRVLFQRLCDLGKTLVLTSHNREDIDILCSRVYQMDGGRCRLCAP